MLILLPPSEGKTRARRGRPLDLDSLSFPELTETRTAVLSALEAVSTGPDAHPILGVPETLAAAVRANGRLRNVPTARAEAVYTGILYDALDVAGMDAAARRRARAWCVVTSALWGAVRLRDRIPAYRLSMAVSLPPLGPLSSVWRRPLATALPAAARRGLVVDCRSSTYATAWQPDGPLAARTVAVRVFREHAGARTVVSHLAKHTRGLVARRIITDALDVRRPAALAEALSAEFRVELTAAPRGWYLDILTD